MPEKTDDEGANGMPDDNGQDELDSLSALQGLRDGLVAHGFESVQVGERNEELFVVFENEIFNANSLDAIGLVMGEVVEHSPAEYEHFVVVMQRNGINVFSVAANIKDYADFLRGDGIFPAVDARQSPGPSLVQGVSMLVKGAARQRFVPRVTLRPELETVVGSEVGMLDYTLALNTELEFPLATGLSFYASHNTHLSDSNDYEDGWYANRSKETEWREAYLSQTFVLPHHITTMIQAGKTNLANETYTFAQNETLLDIAEGRYQLGLIMGKYYDDTHDDDWPVLLGSLRYYWDKPDIRFKAVYGNFLGQDVGYRLESRHYFGDTQIYLSYRDTDTRMVGLGISIPLTPRKDMAPLGGFQLKGDPSWGYGINTVVGENRNPLRFGVAAIPMLRNGIAARYYNHDRLSPVYFRRHVERLREAYYSYQ